MSISQIITIDKGTSTPIDFVDISGNPITIVRTKIAEFGLQVDTPGSVIFGSFNFVDLTGSVGVTNPGDTSTTVRLILTARNTQLLGAPVIDIFSADYTILPGVGLDTINSETLTFSFTQGGIEELIPQAYYAYSLFIQLSPFDVDPLEDPFVSGPISFTGTSSVRNV